MSLVLASLVERFPYLFFKYRAHELRAAPSLSVSVLPPLLLTGDVSRDFNACDERLRDRSDPPNDDDVPYLKYGYSFIINVCNNLRQNFFFKEIRRKFNYIGSLINMTTVIKKKN